MNAVTSLGIVATIVIGTILFALASVRKIPVTPQEFIVGGRGFGAVFMWVLMAGEIYTSFTFLGASGWAYRFGAPAFYIMAYGTIGYIFAYFWLPRLWRWGKEHELLTSPDFFGARYRSKSLMTLMAIVQCIVIVPYVTLQLSGIQILLSVGGYGAVDPKIGAVLAFLAIVFFVFTTGLRGTAWASIMKDALVIGALIFVGIAIPVHFFGSPAVMFEQLAHTHPAMLTFDGWTTPKGNLWYISTVLLTGIAFFCGPHNAPAVYSAKDGDVLRRNAMFLPIYQVLVLLVFFAGFSALLVTPGLVGNAADQSFIALVRGFYPPWVLGFITAAGVLCALIPSTALLLSGASIFAKNIAGDLFGFAVDDRSRVMLTRALVIVLGLLALVMWLFWNKTLVELLLLYYNGIAQFAPGYYLGVFWPRTTGPAVIAGIAVGLPVSLVLAATNAAPYGINAGFLAMLLNAAIVVGVSLASPQKTEEPASLRAPHLG